MKILLTAPQPFFVERGTPIAVRALAETLCRQGHEVDLVVFHGGVDIEAPGLRIFRAPRPPFVRSVPIGLSPAKLACDAALAMTAARLLARRRYQVIHAVEEMIYPALIAKMILGTKVVQDMDSLLVDQIVEKWPSVAWVRAPLDLLERIAIRAANLVLGVCPRIVEHARRQAPGQEVHLLPDIAEPLPTGAPPAGLWNLRQIAGAEADPLMLYVGNLEHYQGVDLLVAAMAHSSIPLTRGRLVVVGGSDAAVAAAKVNADRLGVSDRVRFTGPAPLAHLPWLLRQADILCSPRLIGKNTPMKIYSYMAAGKPILATRIESHTQVLDDRSAMLVDPDPVSVANGIALLAHDRALGARLGAAAAHLAQKHYDPASFERRVRRAYAVLFPFTATSNGSSGNPEEIVRTNA